MGATCVDETATEPNVADIVDKLRKNGTFVAEFSINGQPTYWRIGKGLGESVYRSVCNQPGFIEGQRVCWELMQSMMDEVHRASRDNSKYN